MKTILATAYDVNPYKGSEAGTGWNFILQIARFNNVVAVTRKNNRLNIERYVKEFKIDASKIIFYYYDFPYYLRFWKRGARGSSLYFYLWQMFMPLFIKKNNIQFDITHNINFHADAFPTFLWRLGKPTVWGPINHNERIPRQYIISRRELIKDRLKWLIKLINWNLDPFVHTSKKKVSFVLGGNSSVKKRLKLPNERFLKMSQVAAKDLGFVTKNKIDKFTVLVVGRLIPIKSFDVALKAFDQFYEKLSLEQKNQVQLKIVGSGPLKQSLHSLVDGLVCKEAIGFTGWVEYQEMEEYYRDASVFMFTSHEGGGMVVAEALSFGLPVICFDNFGPGELVDSQCAIRIPYSDYQKSIEDYSYAISLLYLNKPLMGRMSQSARELYENKYTWNAKGIVLKDIYNSIDRKL
mgnify:CR=1 FL=1